MSIKIADGYVDVGLEDHTERDLDRILAKIRAAGTQQGIPIGVDDETARPLRDIDAKLKTWTATHSQSVKITADTAGVERAALAARRTALSAKDAAEKAAVAQKAAAEAAEKLAKGEIKEAEAAKLAADAERQTERASIAATAARLAAADAADKEAAQLRQVARDAELAAAAQRLGSLKATGAVKEHNAVVQELRKKYGDVEKIGGAAFREIEKTGNLAFRTVQKAGQSAFNGISSAASSMAESGPGAIALTVAALAAVPFAALGATSAISLGVGGALAGLGLMAVKGDKDVQAALADMKTNITTEARQIAAPFKQTWLTIARTAQSTFHGLAPELKRDFAVLAPSVSRFVEQAGAAVLKLQPAFHAATNATSELLAQLGPRLPEITANLGRSIEIMANSAAKSAPAFANMAVNVSKVLPPLAHLIDWATKIGPAVSPIFQFLTRGSGSADKFGKSMTGAGSAAAGASTSISTSTMRTQDLLTSQKIATMTTGELQAALEKLTGANQSAFDTQTSYNTALAAAAQQAKKSNAGLSATTKAGRENRQMLSQLAQASKQYIENNNLSAKQIEKVRAAFIKQAEGMGASKKEATQLANELLGVSGNIKKIPSKKITKLEATDNTKDQIKKANGGLSGWAKRSWKTQLRAINMVGGAVSAATRLASGFAKANYRATLRAVNSIGGVVSSATGLATRFAKGNYQATLRAANAVASAFNSAMALGRSWASRVFTATFNVIKHINPFRSGGPVVGYADGGDVDGPVHGPGTGTSDSIPAMLSNGEYVIRAKQAAKYGPLLDMINYGVAGFAGGGAVGKYASGGRVRRRLTPRQKAAQAAAKKRAAEKKKRQTAGQSLVNSIENHLLSSLSSIQSVANKVNDTIKKYFSGKTESKMLAWAKNIEKQWESAAGKLATLNDRIKQAKEYAANTKASIVGSADLSNLGTIGNASDVSSGLAYKLSAMQGFSGKLNQLIKLGLNKNVLSQIINAGPEQGSAIADMLLRDTSQIKTINAEESQIDKISTTIGNTAANVEYDYGKNAGKGFLSGLYGQQAELEKLMKHLGEKLADGLKGKFGLSHKKSPFLGRTPSKKKSKAKKHAAGGIMEAGELALVGEEGPELVTVGEPSRVYTAGQTAAMLDGGGGVHIEGGVHVHVKGTFDFSDPKAAERVAEQIAVAVRERIRRLDRAHK